MKSLKRSVLAAFALAAMLPITASATTTVYPTGTVKYNPEKTWNGFTLLAGGPPRIVDMNGNLVNEWTTGVNGFPSMPLPDGNILTTGVRWTGYIDDGKTLSQLDWDGKTVWEFSDYADVPEDIKNPSKGTIRISTQHHDMQKKGNPVYYTPAVKTTNKVGTTLILGHKWHKNPKVNDAILMDDTVFEVDPNGKVVWEWVAADHFDEYGFDADAKKALQGWKPKKGHEDHGFDWWHQNCASYLGPNKWFDSGDKRFHPDNIILDSREANILVIISRETGKVVWKAGPNYMEGEDQKIGQIVGPHNTHMIPAGLPGAGHVMVYDNGGQAGYGAPSPMGPNGIATIQRMYTRVLEIDPVSKEIVWEYSIKTRKGAPIWKLFGQTEFSPFISGAQRLPNGNTLICEGAQGRLIEVTPDNEVVWEYISPYPGNIPGTNYVYRAYRFPYDWAPEGTHAKEVAVKPVANGNFHIPNVDGVVPNVKSVAKAANLGNVSMTEEDVEEEDTEEEEDGFENTMPKY